MKNDKMLISMDVVICTMLDESLQVVVRRRDKAPYAGRFELPGVYLKGDESLKEGSRRCVRELTGIKDAYMEQMHTFGEVKRDSRERTISITYVALIPASQLVDDEGYLVIDDVELVDMSEMAGSKKMAFDHGKIIAKTLDWFAAKAQVSEIAFNLVDEEFTLPDLQKAYELLLGKPLFKANFRNKMKGVIEETDYMTVGEAHRPSRLFTRK
ncbi:8-oxo-dGTP diphosphatase [Lachnospiraceae bacterium NE2001]|nr:8-oxo-dGTP diphosphatase [Lachnospiraceae bacterium NE2001]